MLCYHNVISLLTASRGPETSKNAKRKRKDKSEDDKKVTAEIANCSFTGEDKTHAPQVMQEQIQPMPSIDM